MLNHIEGPKSTSAAIVLAFASSVFFGLVLWFWDRELLWMLAVLLPPIWTPVLYRRLGGDDSQTVNRALAAVILGLVALLGVGVVVYIIR